MTKTLHAEILEHTDQNNNDSVK
jgi:hypothetical protein